MSANSLCISKLSNYLYCVQDELISAYFWNSGSKNYEHKWNALLGPTLGNNRVVSIQVLRSPNGSEFLIYAKKGDKFFKSVDQSGKIVSHETDSQLTTSIAIFCVEQKNYAYMCVLTDSNSIKMFKMTDDHDLILILEDPHLPRNEDEQLDGQKKGVTDVYSSIHLLPDALAILLGSSDGFVHVKIFSESLSTLSDNSLPITEKSDDPTNTWRVINNPSGGFEDGPHHYLFMSTASWAPDAIPSSSDENLDEFFTSMVLIADRSSSGLSCGGMTNKGHFKMMFIMSEEGLPQLPLSKVKKGQETFPVNLEIDLTSYKWIPHFTDPESPGIPPQPVLLVSTSDDILFPFTINASYKHGNSNAPCMYAGMKPRNKLLPLEPNPAPSASKLNIKPAGNEALSGSPGKSKPALSDFVNICSEKSDGYTDEELDCEESINKSLSPDINLQYVPMIRNLTEDHGLLQNAIIAAMSQIYNDFENRLENLSLTGNVNQMIISKNSSQPSLLYTVSNDLYRLSSKLDEAMCKAEKQRLSIKNFIQTTSAGKRRLNSLLTMESSLIKLDKKLKDSTLNAEEMKIFVNQIIKPELHQIIESFLKELSTPSFLKKGQSNQKSSKSRASLKDRLLHFQSKNASSVLYRPSNEIHHPNSQQTEMEIFFTMPKTISVVDSNLPETIKLKPRQLPLSHCESFSYVDPQSTWSPPNDSKKNLAQSLKLEEKAPRQNQEIHLKNTPIPKSFALAENLSAGKGNMIQKKPSSTQNFPQFQLDKTIDSSRASDPNFAFSTEKLSNSLLSSPLSTPNTVVSPSSGINVGSQTSKTAPESFKLHQFPSNLGRESDNETKNTSSLSNFATNNQEESLKLTVKSPQSSGNDESKNNLSKISPLLNSKLNSDATPPSITSEDSSLVSSEIEYSSKTYGSNLKIPHDILEPGSSEVDNSCSSVADAKSQNTKDSVSSESILDHSLQGLSFEFQQDGQSKNESFNLFKTTSSAFGKPPAAINSENVNSVFSASSSAFGSSFNAFNTSNSVFGVSNNTSSTSNNVFGTLNNNSINSKNESTTTNLFEPINSEKKNTGSELNSKLNQSTSNLSTLTGIKTESLKADNADTNSPFGSASSTFGVSSASPSTSPVVLLPSSIPLVTDDSSGLSKNLFGTSTNVFGASNSVFGSTPSIAFGASNSAFGSSKTDLGTFSSVLHASNSVFPATTANSNSVIQTQSSTVFNASSSTFNSASTAFGSSTSAFAGPNMQSTIPTFATSESASKPSTFTFETNRTQFSTFNAVGFKDSADSKDTAGIQASSINPVFGQTSAFGHNPAAIAPISGGTSGGFSTFSNSQISPFGAFAASQSPFTSASTSNGGNVFGTKPPESSQDEVPKKNLPPSFTQFRL